MPKLSRKELAHRADQVGLALYPLPKGGYMLLGRDENEDPDFARKVLNFGSARDVALFLDGFAYGKGQS